MLDMYENGVRDTNQKVAQMLPGHVPYFRGRYVTYIVSAVPEEHTALPQRAEAQVAVHDHVPAIENIINFKNVWKSQYKKIKNLKNKSQIFFYLYS